MLQHTITNFFLCLCFWIFSETFPLFKIMFFFILFALGVFCEVSSPLSIWDETELVYDPKEKPSPLSTFSVDSLPTNPPLSESSVHPRPPPWILPLTNWPIVGLPVFLFLILKLLGSKGLRVSCIPGVYAEETLIKRFLNQWKRASMMKITAILFSFCFNGICRPAVCL